MLNFTIDYLFTLLLRDTLLSPWIRHPPASILPIKNKTLQKCRSRVLGNGRNGVKFLPWIPPKGYFLYWITSIRRVSYFIIPGVSLVEGMTKSETAPPCVCACVAKDNPKGSVANLRDLGWNPHIFNRIACDRFSFQVFDRSLFIFHCVIDMWYVNWKSYKVIFQCKAMVTMFFKKLFEKKSKKSITKKIFSFPHKDNLPYLPNSTLPQLVTIVLLFTLVEWDGYILFY